MSIVNDVKIANLALSALGADRIMSLTENTTNAKRINEVYIILRDEVMSAHPWNFALKRTTLAQLSSTPVIGYSYAHQIPTDSLRVLNVFNGTEETNEITDFKIENDAILSNYTPLYCRYIYRNEDPTKYSTTFATAFSARLAAELAYPITNSNTLGKVMLEVYQEKLRIARVMDAQESGLPDTLDNEFWIDSRIGPVQRR